MAYPRFTNQPVLQQPLKNKNADYLKLPPPPNLKFRPIVVGPVSPTHRLSNFVDIILKPLCKHVPSYIRDDFYFLKQYTTQNNGGYHIGFLGRDKSVHQHSSLTAMGLKAIEHFLDNFPTFYSDPSRKNSY